MKGLGYQVLKVSSIAFIDGKKVRTKGSEVGFSLMKIEKMIHLKEEIPAKERIYEGQENRSDTPNIFTPAQQVSSEIRQETPDEFVVIEALTKTLDFLLSSPSGEIYDNPPPRPQKKKKRKKRPQQS